ncbi:MAG TPA: hypothetical protein PKC97_11630 [Burkholderiaceae bacterium]|nr:hypothetical protein [Burkholderiaceae bacterium]
MTVKRRRPPDHFDDPSMSRIELGDLPAVLDSELRALIPSGTDPAKIDEFMIQCREAAQRAPSWHGLEPAAGRAKRLRAVEIKCHALVTALLDLHRDDRHELDHAVDRLVNEYADADLSESMRAAVERIKPKDEGRKVVCLGHGSAIVKSHLVAIVDEVQDLEMIAALAADSAKKRASRHERPKIAAARSLAIGAVHAHRDAFGTLPPIGDGWFQAFVARLGESCGITCGVEIANHMIRICQDATKRAT